MNVRILLRTAMCVSVCALTVGAATVSIDATQRHQTIEGFGAFGGLNVGGNHTPSFVNRVIGDLGLSMLRTNTGDAGQSIDEWCGLINAYKAKADELGQEFRVISTTWSPPAYMKVNNSVSGEDANTNKLRPEYYDDYAGVINTFLSEVKQKTTTEVYAVSLQNEPAFPEPYWSCVYTAEEYRDMIKVAGPIIHGAHPNVKLFGPEDMLARWTATGSFLGPLMVDTDSKAQMYALAVHGYTDGVHPTPTSDMVSKWKTAARNVATVGKPLWMTETSGYDCTYSGAYRMAEAIYAALKYGKLAAWTWWCLSRSSCDGEAIMAGENTTKKYFAAKNYYRYIRPGAVMIDAISDNDLVFTVGFHHPTRNTLTIVALNANSGAQTLNVTGSDLPTFNKYVTSSSLDCADQGSTGATGISLPGNSITTLYGENYTPSDVSTGSTTRSVRAPTTRVAGSNADMYSLDGRRLSPHAQRSATMTRRGIVAVDGRAQVVVH